MNFVIKKVTRQKLKLKIGLQGPSGSGKTYSALRLANGITNDWEKIFFIDTENESASYYENLGAFNHISFEPPYHPERYIEAIDACVTAGASVIIIDSISHEWEGKGGCLDLHQREVDSQKFGNSFTAWAKVTPRHNAFVDHMRTAPVHIICCTRAKQDYVIEENSKGKSVPKKVGLKGVQREGLDYELGLVFTIDMDHYAFAEKDRTSLYAGRPKHIITEETGRELLKWANSGVEPRYTGTNDQMMELARICRDEHAIENRDEMREIHEAILAQKINYSALENAIGNYIAERTL